MALGREVRFCCALPPNGPLKPQSVLKHQVFPGNSKKSFSPLLSVWRPERYICPVILERIRPETFTKRRGTLACHLHPGRRVAYPAGQVGDVPPAINQFSEVWIGLGHLIYHSCPQLNGAWVVRIGAGMRPRGGAVPYSRKFMLPPVQGSRTVRANPPWKRNTPYEPIVFIYRI